MLSSTKYLVARLLVATSAALLVPGSVLAQSRIFLAANVGAQAPATTRFDETATAPSRDETATQRNEYRARTGVTVDGTAGFMFNRWLGVAVSGSRYGSRENANFSLTLPQPIAVDAPVTHDGTTDEKLEHTERAVHLSAVLVPKPIDDLDLKFFVGPSKIYVNQALINHLEIAETPLGDDPYDFTIQRAVIDPSSGACACGWGFHVGADVAKYLSRNIGVGAMVRYARANVDLRDAARTNFEGTLVTHKYKAGGFVIAGGVRLRLW
jgi:hypothetical protein